MAFAYSQGDEGRHDELIKQTREYFCKHGYSHLPLTPDDEDRFFGIVNYQFHQSSKGDLAGVVYFLSIMHKFAIGNEKFVINQKYLNWQITLFEKKEYRYRIQIGKDIHKFLCYIPQGIAHKDMSIKFPSIFVHGIDAHIVHTLLAMCHKLNTLFIQHHLPPLLISTTHDCFKVCALYSNLLLPLVQYSYNSINDLEPLLNIPGLLKPTRRFKLIFIHYYTSY